MYLKNVIITVGKCRGFIMRHKKKKIRLKRKFLIMGLFSIGMILILVGLYIASVSFRGEDIVFIDVNTEYKNPVEVYSFNKNVTEDAEVIGTVDTSKIGEYDVEYTYQSAIGIKKSKKVVVKVIDKEPPKIDLNVSDEIEVFLNDKYEDVGYEVKDNYDENVKVTIDGNVDTSIPGKYYLVYKAEDSSHNKSEVVRKITVSRVSPLTLDLKSFDLNEYFPDTIAKQTEAMDKEYMENMVLAGDSVFWLFGKRGTFPSSRVWAKPCEGAYNFTSQKIFVDNAQSKYTLSEMIESKKPKYMILHMGICDINRDDVEGFIEGYEKAIDFIHEKSPDTKFMVASLMPQTTEVIAETSLRNNTKINKYNYYLVELCKRKKVPFLNVAEILKNKNGQAKAEWFYSDGYHPNSTGMKKILEYINTHGFEKE